MLINCSLPSVNTLQSNYTSNGPSVCNTFNEHAEKLNADTVSPPNPVITRLCFFADFFHAFLFHLCDANRECRLPESDINLLVSCGMTPVKHMNREKYTYNGILMFSSQKTEAKRQGSHLTALQSTC